MASATGGGRSRRGVTRRALLAGGSTAGLGAIAGCQGTDDVPDPVTIAADRACDNCTMTVSRYPGPVGQAQYDAPEEVVGEDRPAQFCSSLCTYDHAFEQERAGRDPLGIHLTDYSSVEPTIEADDGEPEADDGEPVISAHLEADAFGPAAELTLVVDSEVRGAMGESMIGFSDADDADAFRTEYGGETLAHDDVTAELVSSLA